MRDRESTIRCAIPDNGKNKTIFNVVLLVAVVATAMTTMKTEDDDGWWCFTANNSSLSPLTITLHFTKRILLALIHKHSRTLMHVYSTEAKRYNFQAREQIMTKSIHNFVCI